MTDERRYDEAEVAWMLQRAADSGPALPADERRPGVTLAELQEAAREAGLDPAAVARAANEVALGAHLPAAVRSAWGLPVGVSRTIEFGGPVSDEAWSRMVLHFRRTFQADGKLLRDGSLREWRNGNLRATLEPTPSGHRLHLSTHKSTARVRLLTSAAYGVLTVGMVGLYGVPSTLQEWGLLAMPAVLGALSFITGPLRLPSWSRERAAQMERLAVELPQIADGRS